MKSQNNRWQEEGIEDKELTFLEEDGNSQEEKAIIISCKLLCLLNLGACYLKLKDPFTAICACNEVLKLDPLNVKALYRRAKAKVQPSNSGNKRI